MAKKNIDWANLGFQYQTTAMRYVSDFKEGKWDEGRLTEDANVVLNECAGVLQYAQTIFEGLKAYTTEDGRIVTFRPDLNADRMVDSAKRLEMPVFPKERFLDAVHQTVAANADYVPPYGSGASLYIRPYMFGTNPVIGVKPADEYQFRVFVTPVGPYFKGGVKPLTICVSDFDRAAPHGTGHIKAGLNYAMSLHAIQTAHRAGFDENMYLYTQKVISVLNQYFAELEQQEPYFLTADTEIDMVAVFKAMGVKVENYADDYIQNISQYMKLVAELLAKKVIIFVNLRSYMEIGQIEAVMKEAAHNEMAVLFIESSQKSFPKDVVQYIIDKDICEI